MQVVLDWGECERESGLRTSWQWPLAAVSVTVTWLNLLSLIRKLPYLGIYVVMVGTVLQTFLKVSAVVVLFVIAFSLGFYALLENQEYFGDFFKSLIKTFVMTSGELEYDNIFFGEHILDEAVPYLWTTRVFFVSFVIIMPIIIMNLLVGLAVDDIKGVQESAVLQRLAMQVELTLNVEKLLPECIKRRWAAGRERLLASRDELARRAVTRGRGRAGRAAAGPDTATLAAGLQQLQTELERTNALLAAES